MSYLQLPISKKIYLQLFDTLEGCIFVINPQMQLLMFNKLFADIYQAQYGIPPPLYEVYRPIYLAFPSVEQILQQSYLKGFSGEKLIETIIYDDKPSEVYITPIFADNNQEVEALVVHIKPKAATTHFSEKIALQQQQYQDIMDNIHDIVFQTDIQGNWVFLNKAWNSIMHFSVEESLGQSFLSFLHPDDLEKARALFQSFISHQKNEYKHAIRYLTKEKQVKWLEVFATLLFDEQNQIIGISGTLKDTTNDITNVHLYELLSNNVRDLVCIHDLDGTFLYVSPYIKALAGYDTHELINQSAYSFIHPEDIEHVARKNQELKNTIGSSDYIEYRFRKKDGSYVWLEVSFKVFFDEYSIAYRVITSSREIEARKKSEESIMKALKQEKELNELMAKFVNFTSHEFRTPLATIRTSTEIIEAYTQKVPENAKIYNHTQLIHSEISRMTRLIDEILLIGKIDSEKSVAQKEKTDLLVIIQHITERQNLLQKDNRRAELIVEGTPYPIVLDPDQIELAIDNLIANSFKYSVGQKAPIIHVHFTPDMVKISVQDFGIGISEAEQHKLFTPFFRAKNVGNIKGSGLGLTIVKNFIYLNGGEITFKSTEKLGTTFYITFLNKLGST